MKKTLLVALVFLCLFNMCGCAHNISDKTSFYYCSADYQFGKDASVIQSEVRDILRLQDLSLWNRCRKGLLTRSPDLSRVTESYP